MASPNSVSLESWLKLFFFQMCKLHTTPLIHGQHLHRSAGADRGLVSPTAGRTDGVSVWQLPELAPGNQ